MSDEDLSGLLPEPPPPRPASRAAALDQAMRRFDGLPDPAPAAAPKAETAASRWWAQRPTQFGAFASIVLVGFIAIPLALQTPREAYAPSQAPGAPREVTPVRATPPEPQPAPPTAPQRPVSAPAPVARSAVTSRETPAPARVAPAPEALLPAPPAPAAPPPPPPPPPPPAVEPVARAARNSDEPITVTAARVSRAAPAIATPTVAKAEPARDEGQEIVITGSRLSRSSNRAARHGDWNACTVDDPKQSLDGCKHLVNPGRKGTAGAAAAKLADGIKLAWQGDWEAATKAMDQAVALKPDYAFAYLNRGLAHRREGALESAAADLDRAVRQAPQEARGYYQRSIVKRMRGDARGAADDAARAAALDSRYEGLAP